mmetsp:Transcript_10491/g.27463  ORF Transcript_10491/g.27463 Transcript_10491/m.27463 type:complete len:259 (-) Transcript_10491:240-1016(-)
MSTPFVVGVGIFERFFDVLVCGLVVYNQVRMKAAKSKYEEEQHKGVYHYHKGDGISGNGIYPRLSSSSLPFVHFVPHYTIESKEGVDDIVHVEYGEKTNKSVEEPVVASTNAVAHPWAVVIKSLHTCITRVTVVDAMRAVKMTGIAVFQPDDEPAVRRVPPFLPVCAHRVDIFAWPAKPRHNTGVGACREEEEEKARHEQYCVNNEGRQPVVIIYRNGLENVEEGGRNENQKESDSSTVSVRTRYAPSSTHKFIPCLP